MELKDFVKETLLQITQGIKEAQEATEEYSRGLNPSSYNSGENYNHATIKNKKYPIQDVEFEVALTASTEEGNKSGIGVAFGAFAIGGNKNSGEKNVSVTNIKFTIPAVFPTVDSENKPVYPTVLKNPRQNRM